MFTVSMCQNSKKKHLFLQDKLVPMVHNILIAKVYYSFNFLAVFGD